MSLREFRSYQNIVVLTGAGISAASGIPTFRGGGGLWGGESAMPPSPNIQATSGQFDLTLFAQRLRDLTRAAAPNSGHLALARFEASLSPGHKFTLITQNVDGLHQRAGSQNVLEIHGNVHRFRCFDSQCPARPDCDSAAFGEEELKCSICCGTLLPDLVRFGEPLIAFAEWHAKRALRDCDLFIAVGTSGSVAPASQFVHSALYSGAHTVFINLEAIEGTFQSFKDVYVGRAEELLPRLFV